MSRVRKLAVQLHTDTGKSVYRLEQMGQKVNGLRDRFNQLGATMDRIGKQGFMRVTAPLMAMATGMVKVASDAEEMQSKFNVVFGDMAESTERWARETSSAVGRSRLDLMGYLAETQNMLVGMGQARNEAALFSQDITQLGVDLASFNNLAESDAINSLQSALSGVHTAARSLGAVLNENTLALAMQDMGLKGTFQQMDETRKMQIRYRAIVMQSEDAMGDAERTSGSFANQMRALKGEIKDLSADLGKELLPYATSFVGLLRQATDRFSELSPATKTWSLRLAGIAATIPVIALVLSAIIKLVMFIKGVALVVFTVLGAKIAAIVAILVGLGFVIQDVWTYFQGGESITGNLVDYITNKFEGMVDWFKLLPGKIKDALKGMGGAIKGQFTDALQGVRNLLPFSPPKDPSSPLRDLQKAGQSIVGNIREGMNDAAGDVSFNEPVGATAAPVMSGGGGTFSPNIRINVNGGSDAQETADRTKSAIERMMPGLMDDFFRRTARQV